MTPEARPTTAELVERLGAVANAKRAVNEKAYLKSEREFLGVSVPDGRRVVRQLAKDHGLRDHDDVIAVAGDWWSGPWWECRRAAVELLRFRRDTLGPTDLPCLESLIREGETWAIVDDLASGVVGGIVDRGPDPLVDQTLDRWSSDPDSLWVRRASMLALLRSLRRDLAEWPRFCRFADAMLDEREFFIRKAIGWVLRDVSKIHPELVHAWVEPRMARMSGVTRREALKYL